MIAKRKVHFQNTADFILEIINSLRFYVDYMRGKPFTSSKGPREGHKMNFGDAFGLTTTKEQKPTQQMAPEVTPEEAGLLRPYPFASTQESGHV